MNVTFLKVNTLLVAPVPSLGNAFRIDVSSPSKAFTALFWYHQTIASMKFYFLQC
jgi:hypothetical protein